MEGSTTRAIRRGWPFLVEEVTEFVFEEIERKIGILTFLLKEAVNLSLIGRSRWFWESFPDESEPGSGLEEFFFRRVPFRTSVSDVSP